MKPHFKIFSAFVLLLSAACKPSSLTEEEARIVASLSLSALPPLPADPSNRVADDPAAAVEAIQSLREEIGFSYFVFGAAYAERFAPVVAALAGR